MQVTTSHAAAVIDFDTDAVLVAKRVALASCLVKKSLLGKVRLGVVLSKVDAQLGLHAWRGDFQHPGCWVQTLLNGGHSFHPLCQNQNREQEDYDGDQEAKQGRLRLCGSAAEKNKQGRALKHPQSGSAPTQWR